MRKLGNGQKWKQQNGSIRDKSEFVKIHRICLFLIIEQHSIKMIDDKFKKIKHRYGGEQKS